MEQAYNTKTASDLQQINKLKSTDKLIVESEGTNLSVGIDQLVSGVSETIYAAQNVGTTITPDSIGAAYKYHTHDQYALVVDFNTHTNNNLIHMSESDRTKLNDIISNRLVLSDITPSAIGASPVNHTHSQYSLVTHTHDERYSKLDHNHDDRYSKLDHDHDERYTQTVYFDEHITNDSIHVTEADRNRWNATAGAGLTIADITPEAIGAARTVHSHTGYASSDHDHNGVYSPVNHNHDSTYATIRGLSNHISDSTVHVTEADRNRWNALAGSSLTIDDITPDAIGAAPADHSHNTIYYTKTEIDQELLNKADIDHTHDEYALASEVLSQELLDDALLTKADIDHTHEEYIKKDGDEDTIIQLLTSVGMSPDDITEMQNNITALIDKVDILWNAMLKFHPEFEEMLKTTD